MHSLWLRLYEKWRFGICGDRYIWIVSKTGNLDKWNLSSTGWKPQTGRGGDIFTNIVDSWGSLEFGAGTGKFVLERRECVEWEIIKVEGRGS